MMSRTTFIYLYIFLFSSTISWAQKEDVNYQFNKGDIIISFKNLNDKTKLDSLLKLVGSSKDMTDSLDGLDKKKLTPLGWELFVFNKEKIVYKKSIRDLQAEEISEKIDLSEVDKIEIRKEKYELKYYDPIEDFLFGIDNKKKLPYELDVTYGFNQFNLNSVKVNENNEVTFKLFSRSKATQVYLAGTFNDWSTLNTPMIQRNGIWEKKIKLKPGKHLYKFIVDGKWITDPLNRKLEKDRNGNVNSVYFINNHFFYLDGYQDAKNVHVAGSFNNWKRKELEMRKKDGKWIIPLFLSEGTHSYKYIVDGKWIVDPSNRSVKTDANGNKNSYLFFGNKYIFKLRKFLDAEKVVVSGDFNNWNRAELLMTLQDSLWVLPYFLKPGNYAYKFIVDGEWMVDPENKHTIGRRRMTNSVTSVKPNHTFILKKFSKAKEVLLTGTFNNWSEEGYTMKKEDGYWRIDIYVPPGKTLYKFIVDGKWIKDPENPLWEYNRYSTKNSILWKEKFN